MNQFPRDGPPAHVNGYCYNRRLQRWVMVAQSSGTSPHSSFPTTGTYHARFHPGLGGPSSSRGSNDASQYVERVTPPQTSSVFNQDHLQLTLPQPIAALPFLPPEPYLPPRIDMSRYSVQLGSSQLPPARVPNIGTSVANGCSPSHLPSGSTFSPPYFSAYTMWNGLPPQDPMNRRPQLTILRQSKYTRGQPFDNEEQRIPTISFGALNMHEALEDDCASLEDRMRPAWAKELRTATKLSIVFSFDGHPTPYTHQVHILRAGGEPPERARLAGVVARELQRFMAENPDQPLRAHGRSVGFEELLLVEVEHVSKGSLQPTIGVASK